MGLVRPSRARAQVEDHLSEIRVTIRPAFEAGVGCVALFLTAWLVGWAVGEYSAIRELFRLLGPEGRSGGGFELFGVGFLIVWLTGWTFGGLAAIYFLIHMVAGTEIVSFTADEIVVVQRPVPRARRFALSDVRNLHIQRPTAADEGAESTRRTVALAFDYGARTYRVGGGLDADEAETLMGKLRVRYGRHIMFDETA